MEEQPQSKRKRRPSVRLGEIGFAGSYDASELWLEPPRQRRKAAGKGSGGKKAPRIRPLEHVAGDKEVAEEEWSVDEPAVASADEEKVAADCAGPASTPAKEQCVKRRSGLIARKPRLNNQVRRPNNQEHELVWQGSRVRCKHEEATRPETAVDANSPENREDEEEKESFPLQADDETPFLAGTLSDSEELMGSALKEEEELRADDSGNGASDRSEEGDAGANPNCPCNSHLGLNVENGSIGGGVAKQHRCTVIIPANPNGDDMQGAIEDGPGQANGRGFSTVKQREGERRSGRQAARRKSASRDTVNRDTAGEPSSRAPAAANGTTVVTPCSGQRVASLYAGVSEWLQDLGLGKYSELFELNEVDTEVLPLLTMDDLREMGVDAVGARRKMFTNIQELALLRAM